MGRSSGASCLTCGHPGHCDFYHMTGHRYKNISIMFFGRYGSHALCVGSVFALDTTQTPPGVTGCVQPPHGSCGRTEAKGPSVTARAARRGPNAGGPTEQDMQKDGRKAVQQ